MDIVGVLGLPGNFDRRIHASDAGTDQSTVLSVGPCVVRHGSGSFLRDLRDGLANSGIGSAAAEIAAEAVADVVGAGLRMFVEEGLAGDDESGSAEAALRSIVLDECLLHRMQ